MSLSTEFGHRQMESDHDESHREMSDDNDPDWDRALEAEDCVRVRELLEKNEKLLIKGWKERKASEAEDGARLVEASLQFKPQHVWKGRTALHVAARRGDDELVLQIQNILHPKGRECSIQCHLLEVIDSDYELNALAMAVVNGNQRIVNLLKQTSRECKFNPYYISHEATDGAPHEDGENKAGLWKENVNASEEITKKALDNSQVKELCDKDCTLNPYRISRLEKITEAALKKNPGVLPQVKELYDKDCDFNFLKINRYLFHFTFSTWKSNDTRNNYMRPIKEEIFSQAKKTPELLYCLLLHLKDGQGRTPLHVAVDSNKVKEFLELMSSEGKNADFDATSILNAKDSAGRTPLYRAAAKDQSFAVEELLKDAKVDLEEKISCRSDQWGTGLDIDKLSWRNNFKSDCVYILKEKLRRKAFNNESNAQGGPGPIIMPLEEISSTALHVAIILKREDVVAHIVDKLLQMANGDGKDRRHPRCMRRFTWPVGAWKDTSTRIASVSTMKLAVLVGSIPILQTLLKAEEQKRGLFTTPTDEREMSSFHLAAAMGNPGTIKAFLDSERRQFDPRKQDCYKNTALHHALKGKYVKFHPHLVDFVGCHHVFYWRWGHDDWKSEWLANPQEIQMPRVVEKDDNVQLKDRCGQRMGSINLLLEAGIDIWEKNLSERTANPEPDALEEFVKWWYEKVAKETQQVQKTLNAAANAISVTAALVATASYVGPLSPPLGFDGDSLQVNVLAVRIFAVCDSLSFYFALAAIMLALLPSLPLPQESMFRELVRTRMLVAFAVTFLFPSIVCVLVAFAAAYIAVIPDHGLAHHGLTMATTVVGGLLCLGVMYVFFGRLLKVFITLPKDVWGEIGRFFMEDAGFSWIYRHVVAGVNSTPSS